MSLGMKRVLGAQMEVAAAFEAAKRAQRESEKERRPVPQVVSDKLRADKALALGNLEQAMAAAEAANRFPPVRR
jgi:hypothetical protein